MTYPQPTADEIEQLIVKFRENKHSEVIKVTNVSPPGQTTWIQLAWNLNGKLLTPEFKVTNVQISSPPSNPDDPLDKRPKSDAKSNSVDIGITKSELGRIGELIEAYDRGSKIEIPENTDGEQPAFREAIIAATNIVAKSMRVSKGEKAFALMQYWYGKAAKTPFARLNEQIVHVKADFAVYPQNHAFAGKQKTSIVDATKLIYVNGAPKLDTYTIDGALLSKQNAYRAFTKGSVLKVAQISLAQANVSQLGLSNKITLQAASLLTVAQYVDVTASLYSDDSFVEEAKKYEQKDSTSTNNQAVEAVDPVDPVDNAVNALANISLTKDEQEIANALDIV